jgi:hypothetical protein
MHTTIGEYDVKAGHGKGRRARDRDRRKATQSGHLAPELRAQRQPGTGSISGFTEAKASG